MGVLGGSTASLDIANWHPTVAQFLRLSRHPFQNLVRRFPWRGAEDVVVGTPDDFVIAQGRTIFPEPAAGERPRHEGIENSSQAKHRQPGLAGNRARIGLGNQMQAMLRGAAIQFRPADNEFVNGRQRLG